jgi:hypothetical protein
MNSQDTFSFIIVHPQIDIDGEKARTSELLEVSAKVNALAASHAAREIRQHSVIHQVVHQDHLAG